MEISSTGRIITGSHDGYLYIQNGKLFKNGEEVFLCGVVDTESFLNKRSPHEYAQVLVDNNFNYVSIWLWAPTSDWTGYTWTYNFWHNDRQGFLDRLENIIEIYKSYGLSYSIVLNGGMGIPTNIRSLSNREVSYINYGRDSDPHRTFVEYCSSIVGHFKDDPSFLYWSAFAELSLSDISSDVQADDYNTIREWVIEDVREETGDVHLFIGHEAWISSNQADRWAKCQKAADVFGADQYGITMSGSFPSNHFMTKANEYNKPLLLTEWGFQSGRFDGVTPPQQRSDEEIAGAIRRAMQSMKSQGVSGHCFWTFWVTGTHIVPENNPQTMQVFKEENSGLLS